MSTENKYTPHIHAEAIKAWADGKPIQFLHNGVWIRCGDTAGPAWHPQYSYRAKPEEVVDYTVVFSSGVVGAKYLSSTGDAKIFYDNSLDNFQGFCKRTAIDGKVVSLEFIPK